jgi:acylphosphatase
MLSHVISVSLTITGRVQGVGYRYFVLKRAIELGLNGFVQNLPNGSVYVEVEGFVEAVNLLIDSCRKGPAFAKVRDVEINLITPKNAIAFIIQ